MTSAAVLLVSIDDQISMVERQIDYLLRTAPARRKGKGVRFVDRDLDTWRAVLKTLQDEKAARGVNTVRVPACNVRPTEPCAQVGACDSLWCAHVGEHGGVQYQRAGKPR